MSHKSDRKDPAVVIELADSITHVAPAESVCKIVICGSHGGLSAAILALPKKIKGVIFNDAGIGKDRAGIAGLDLLDKYGIMAATVDTMTAKIGIAQETEKGNLSHMNRSAENAGISIGTLASEAARTMAEAEPLPRADDPAHRTVEEKMTVVYRSDTGHRIVTLDSNAMVTAENRMDIILTGSHGGLVGNRPAVKYPVLAAFYNDAGVGKDRAGISRLPRLQQMGIPAATVDAGSARIGIGLDTYETGIISHVNPMADALGMVPGMPAKAAALRLLKWCNDDSFRGLRRKYHDP
jgi:hypothetical protein